MRREFILGVIALSLFVGCASKKVDTIGISGDGSSMASSGGGATGTQINRYENVDPYGQAGEYGSRDYTQNSGYGEINEGIQKIYFEVDQYLITPDKLPVVIHDAKILKEATRAGARVKIEGYCDATGSDEYNYALGLKRAKSAKDAIVVRGVNPKLISMVSMGESAPACTRDFSAECLAKNRRVEFKVVE